MPHTTGNKHCGNVLDRRGREDVNTVPDVCIKQLDVKIIREVISFEFSCLFPVYSDVILLSITARCVHTHVPSGLQSSRRSTLSGFRWVLQPAGSTVPSVPCDYLASLQNLIRPLTAERA